MTETHRIKTKVGPVDVRVYRLAQGWWPVAWSGWGSLPAYPVIDEQFPPRSVQAAVRSLQYVIDGMLATEPAPTFSTGAGIGVHARGRDRASLTSVRSSERRRRRP